MFKGWNKFEKGLILTATMIIFLLSLYWKDSLLGIIGSVTGVICVILTAKGKLSCYIFGLINILAYIIIAWNQKFYGEVMLNALYYLPMQFIGFYMWKKQINDETDTVKAEKLSFLKRTIWIAISVLGIIGYGFMLKKLGGNLPYIDSISTVLSIVAMILSVRRYMEQWVIWIIVDVVSIIMWATTLAKGGHDIATLLMWTTYLVNAVYGYIKWNKECEDLCIE